MPDRQPCLVPFCRRTRPGDTRFSEWICAAHWLRVSPATKARKQLIDRRARKLVRAGSAVEIARRQTSAAWECCRAEAIEAAGGIS